MTEPIRMVRKVPTNGTDRLTCEPRRIREYRSRPSESVPQKFQRPPSPTLMSRTLPGMIHRIRYGSPRWKNRMGKRCSRSSV